MRPLDSVDSRWVFRLYAVLVGATGVFVTLWGSLWVGGPLNGQAWGINSLVRIAGTAIVLVACCAAAFSQVADPADRRRALLWFTAGHFIALAIADIQATEVWGPALPRWARASMYVFIGVSMALLYALARERGMPAGAWRGGLIDLFKSPPPSTTQQLRSEYEQQIRLAAAQEERNRLARDLHDSIKQQIFVVQTAAATAEARLSTDATGVADALARVRDSARDMMTEMDAMTDHLKSAPMENVGLVDTLRKQADALRLRTGATVDVFVGRLPRSELLPPGAHQALFRIAQEALANVGRHARAQHVTVRLEGGGNRLDLTVQDDGQGFDSASTPRGQGLNNIRARAAELGAETTLTTSPGGGTRIWVSVPCETPEPAYFQKMALLNAGLAAVMVIFFVYGGPQRVFGLLIVFTIWLLDTLRFTFAWRRARALGEEQA